MEELEFTVRRGDDGGLGIRVSAQNTCLEIISPPGGGGEHPIQVGDEIISIDGHLLQGVRLREKLREIGSKRAHDFCVRRRLAPAEGWDGAALAAEAARAVARVEAVVAAAREEERPLPSSPYRPPEQEQAARPPDRLAKQRGSPAQARPPRRSRDSAGEILSTEAAARAAEGKSPAEVVLGDDDDNDTLQAKVLALKDQLRLSQAAQDKLRRASEMKRREDAQRYEDDVEALLDAAEEQHALKLAIAVQTAREVEAQEQKQRREAEAAAKAGELKALKEHAQMSVEEAVARARHEGKVALEDALSRAEAMSRDRLRDALAEADRSGKQRMELALAAEASVAKARVSDAEEKLRRQVEELKTLATKVVGLTAEKDNLSSRLDRTTGDLARERKAVRDMTELKEHQLSEMQAAHSRVLEAKREEATKQLREVKIEVREAKLEAGRQIREAEMKARDSIHEAQAEAARQMDEVAEEKRATEAERESVRVQLSREQREMRAAVEAELRKHEMENAKLHEELGRAHVVCRAAAKLYFFFFSYYLFICL
uniref:PDZ domain-containing protein n=1 Tax=Emiliania huxleyi TaxID=2903 RepID=A0A7S3T102_EMIHU